MKKKRQFKGPAYHGGLRSWRMARRRWLLAACIGLLVARAGAQDTFAYWSALDTVRATGFYRIILSPELIAKCRADLADLRILGPDNRFVPYVLTDSSKEKDLKNLWAPIPGSMSQKDSSNKHSFITLLYPDNYRIGWLAFRVRDPVFYKRDAVVYAEGANPGEWSSIADITIDPWHLTFFLPPTRTRQLRIDVANKDNAPLVIVDAAGFQESVCLLAYLKASSGYQVLAGNEKAVAPEYDLKYFIDSLKEKPADLLTGRLQPMSDKDQPRGATETPTPNPKKTGVGKDHSGILLWSVITLVLLLLIYLSVKLARATAQKDANNRL
jgi:hypothetical protein